MAKKGIHKNKYEDSLKKETKFLEQFLSNKKPRIKWFCDSWFSLGSEKLASNLEIIKEISDKGINVDPRGIFLYSGRIYNKIISIYCDLIKSTLV